VQYAWNRLGEPLAMTDQNQTVHAYARDVLGRPLADAVTTLGSGVDGLVRRQETSYDVLGRPLSLSSFDAAEGGNLVNEATRSYHDLGLPAEEWQAVSGPVGPTTPSVQYAYDATGRLTSLTYPNGRVIAYNYAGSDALLGRPSSLSDGAVTLEAYTYLGAGRVVERSQPQPGLALSFVKRPGEPDGDGGDAYTGFDRFGRILDQRWVRADGSAVVRQEHAYDRNSNKTYTDDLVLPALSELYQENDAPTNEAYDALNRLTAWARGVLSAGGVNNGSRLDTIVAPGKTQTWDLDLIGNWQATAVDGVPESRTHNAQNELRAQGATPLTYDANGNLTENAAGQKYRWDVWNRLREVRSPADVVLATYTYDPAGRRVTKTIGSVTTAVYWTLGWQELERRQGETVTESFVWSPVYIDALLCRDSGTGLATRHYFQHDHRYSVSAITNSAGQVVERYTYDAYGKITVRDAAGDPKASQVPMQPYGYTGREFDAESGLWYFRARMYDDQLGRFVNRDPLGYVDGMNLYQGYFVPGGVDPWGLTVADMMQAVYNILAALCENQNCCNKTNCTQQECKTEAALIARDYINTHSMYRDPNNNQGHIKDGRYCFQWAHIIEKQLRRSAFKCWTINLVSKASHKTDHTYVWVSMGEPLEQVDGKTERNQCGAALDPWKENQPLAYPFGQHIDDWNLLRDPTKFNGLELGPDGNYILPNNLGLNSNGEWVPFVDPIPPELMKDLKGAHPADSERGREPLDPPRAPSEWRREMDLNWTPRQ
jgi:RHS repeat-associated protein